MSSTVTTTSTLHDALQNEHDIAKRASEQYGKLQMHAAAHERSSYAKGLARAIDVAKKHTEDASSRADKVLDEFTEWVGARQRELEKVVEQESSYMSMFHASELHYIRQTWSKLAELAKKYPENK